MRILNLLIIVLIINGCKGQNENSDIKKLNNSERKQIINNSLIETDSKKEDVLIIEDESTVVLLFPSEKEIYSLKKSWGEDKFYLAADGENGYFSSIFKLLKDRKEKYISTDKKTIFFKSSKLYFKKKDLKNAWGVVYSRNNKLFFSNTIDYISSLSENLNNKTINNCEIDKISDKFSFQITQYDKVPIKEKILINIENKKTLRTQKIVYNFNSILSEVIPCSSFSYFKNKVKINEGAEIFHSFIIIDLNFDGLEDFAYLWDSGGNGGPSFKYFFQNENEEFFEDNNFPIQKSYFPAEINTKEKTITLISPIGCCKTSKIVYQIQNSQWKIISSKEENLKN